ncbi:aromatic ring-hydroxylating dioxygenase subunit alpha [Defluviimonas sp. WL0024]|uniref:Aromatic ring-hydroxylating dioxygenase subunit alpha n=1 Tax=Albidovulum salinarum TaxID=2984153 RepID=A0ABT2X5D7_9RHOB|nr:aromatic ring-hydroxylating dioxygenase subunit alpha [Defluviimonas sp. WL0024]MCU9849146.1 aromatic ring-hydroxylating dioxygenase subunit alpha [Defluviimonas sp. WL0024]
MTEHRHPASPLLDHCPETLPAAAYVDPDWYERERQAIWSRNWIAAGRLSDLAPGTMRRFDLAGHNVVLCRDGKGTVTAFHNACRHRGSELCTKDRQELGKLIRCPYHAWAYDTGGRLVSTAHATPTEDFRKEDHGLFPVRVRIWNGFVFLCLADEPEELAPDLGLAALDNWPMEDLRTGHRVVKEIACNWKVFWENYNECLHCPGIHPELCDMVPVYRDGIMSPEEAPGWTGDAPRPPALREKARTWTMTGEPCGPEFMRLTAEERANGHNFVTIYPTMFVVAHVDYVRSVSLMPLGPERTRLTAEWLFSEETLAQPGFDAASVAEFATLVMSQDAEACEMNQRGLRSARYAGGRLMPQEFDILRFHDWVRRQMETTAGETL